MWKLCNLPLPKRKIYSTLISFSVPSFLSLTMPKSVHGWPPHWTGLWIPSPNLSLPHQINWFKLQTSLICKKEKATSYEKWLLGGVLQKKISKNFTKFTEKYLCYNLFLILLKTVRPSGLQLYWKETPALVFQNQPFVDHLQNICSWINHKIPRKTPMLESLFK